MPKYNFKFGGSWLNRFGAVSAEPPPLEIAQRDVTFVKIPGKNGDDCIDNHRYGNVEMKRKIAVIGDADGKAKALIRHLAYLQGYQEFEDTDHPGMVTRAALTNFSTAQRRLRTLRTAELVFTREPFWYLKSGLEEITLDTLQLTGTGVTFNNPYPGEAEPIIRFYITNNTSSPIACAINFSMRTTQNGETLSAYFNETLTFPASYSVLEYDLDRRQAAIKNTDGEVYQYRSLNLPYPFGSETVLQLHNTDKIAAVTVVPRWRCL